jgi:hypothetical protein
VAASRRALPPLQPVLHACAPTAATYMSGRWVLLTERGIRTPQLSQPPIMPVPSLTNSQRGQLHTVSQYRLQRGLPA